MPGSGSSGVESIDWYHPNITRHVAESLLLQNGTDGTYLLRDSSRVGDYALSVRCDKSVKHYNVTWTGMEFKFGHGSFQSLHDFIEHFSNKPLIGGESGQLVLLRFPYPRDIDEPEIYEQVTVHAEFSVAEERDARPDFFTGTKEGYLTKIGDFRKSWKARWFVLKRNVLSYYADKESKKPKRVLDLYECLECVQDDQSHKTKKNVFKLVFPWRTFYLYATTDQDMQEWIKYVNFRLNSRQR